MRKKEQCVQSRLMKVNMLEPEQLRQGREGGNQAGKADTAQPWVLVPYMQAEQDQW